MSEEKKEGIVELRLDGFFDKVNGNGVIYPSKIFEEAFAKGKKFPITLEGKPIGEVEITSQHNGEDAVGFISIGHELVQKETNNSFSIRGHQKKDGDLNIVSWNLISDTP